MTKKCSCYISDELEKYHKLEMEKLFKLRESIIKDSLRELEKINTKSSADLKWNAFNRNIRIESYPDGHNQLMIDDNTVLAVWKEYSVWRF